jgi:hypothetical protein
MIGHPPPSLEIIIMVRCAGLCSQVLFLIKRHHFAAAARRFGAKREPKVAIAGIKSPLRS